MFELWEQPEQRLERVRELVRACVDGRVTEQVAYVNGEPVDVKVTVTIDHRPVLYRTSRRPSRARRFEAFRKPQRIESRAYAPFA